MKKLIAINLTKDEAIAALVEYAMRTGKITYRGPAQLYALIFQNEGKIEQIRVELQYEEKAVGG